MNNRESIFILDSKSNSKYTLDESTDISKSQWDIQKPPHSISPSTSNSQNISTDHNRKRSKSFSSSSTKDLLVPIERAKILSRFISHSESPVNDSRNIDNLQTQIHPESSRHIKLSLPNHATDDGKIHISADFQTTAFPGTKFCSDISNTSSQVKDSISRLIDKNVNSARNSIDTSPEEGSGGNTTECQTFSSKGKKDVRVTPEHNYEEIDETDSECVNKFSEFNTSNTDTSDYLQVRQHFEKNRAFFNKDVESVNPVNQRRNQKRFASPDKDDSKVETEMYSIENDEDEIWKCYMERPLLPLKPLQKQKSMSCVNLVQTIKGLSKRKTSANSRHSSPMNNVKNLLFPENALIQKREIFTSEVNISEIRTELDASADLTVRRVDDTNFAAKKGRQSLLPNYAWFHPVDKREASKRLLKMHVNGAFLIRPASNPTSEVLHTLCVVCSHRVYNFHVKSLKDGRITLGKGQEHQSIFSSLLDMIKYHQTVPISINTAETNQVAYVYLLITPPK